MVLHREVEAAHIDLKQRVFIGRTAEARVSRTGGPTAGVVLVEIFGFLMLIQVLLCRYMLRVALI